MTRLERLYNAMKPFVENDGNMLDSVVTESIINSFCPPGIRIKDGNACYLSCPINIPCCDCWNQEVLNDD